MAYNVFLHSSSEAPSIYTFMPTLFKLLFPKTQDTWMIKNLEFIWMACQKFMMTVLNLKMARNKYPPPIRYPDRTDFKIGDMILTKNHIPKDALDSKNKPRFRICKKNIGQGI